MPPMMSDTQQALYVAIANIGECDPSLASLLLQPQRWAGSTLSLTRHNNNIGDIRAILTDVKVSLNGLDVALVAKQMQLQQRGDEYKANWHKTQQTLALRTAALNAATIRNDELQRRSDACKAESQAVQQTLTLRTAALNAATARTDDLQRRGDAYRAEAQTAQLALAQRTESLGLATRRQQDHQQALAIANDDLRHYQRLNVEKEQTIDGLKAQLRAANHRLERLTPLAPSDAPGRPSTDSGFSDGSGASSSAADSARQEIALSLLSTAVAEFTRGEYAQADASLASVQRHVRDLPASLQKPFKPATMAYYRAVCTAETGTDAAAKASLTAFLSDYGRAEARHTAHATHLLARTYIKLGRHEDALTRCYEARGLWRAVDPNGDEYFDAVALLARVFHHLHKPREMLAVINLCPEERRDIADYSSCCRSRSAGGGETAPASASSGGERAVRDDDVE
ncbi:hypothetical protein LTR53_013556 [Teratosphaeriaceae sp. CCFEE 6253]|nr:hypothetical protein LTR53_013556 [Teratosphaeriaceae sp. CCFEE 6253]